MVCIQIQQQSHRDNYGIDDKPRAVRYPREKREQKDPKGGIISRPNERKGVSTPLLDWHVVIRILPKPGEPHGCVVLDDYSIKNSDNRKPYQSTPRRPKRSGKSDEDISQSGDT
jgi:hypothetical protein